MLTYGFYNSVNKDRKYDAEQIGAMFDGLINDGIYANYKEAMKIVPGSGHRHIVIRPGRAWFNGTWTLIDDGGHSFYIAGSQVTTTYYIYLCVSKNDRTNSIAYYNEVRESEPDKGKFFYLMGQVTIPAGVNAITEDMIVDLRGSTHCPFVTGILETADFEQIVRETCSENWLVWLNSYEEGLDAKMNQIEALADKANTSADLAIATVQNLRHLAYRWAKYHAILVQGGSLGWVLAIDTPDSYGEPPKRILYREFAFDGVNCTLSDPVSTTGISAADQYDNYRSAPYFNGDGYGGTVAGQIYRYERMTENVKMSGNSVTITYGYRVSCAKLVEGTYEPGAYIETVEAQYPSEYPLDGYKDGYWYTRFASRASDVFFDNTGLSISARTVQEAIVALYKNGGNGNDNSASKSHVEVDSLPDSGVSGVIYVVKNPDGGDSDEYIWVDRWEKLGGSRDSGENPSYELPVGGDELGGVKNGGNVVINADGTMTAPEGGSSYTLPVANSTTLGGVKAQAKTAAMTQPVGVDEDGNLYTLPPAQNTTNVDGVSFNHHAGNLFDGNEYRGAMPAVGDDIFSPAGTSTYKYIVFRAKPNTEYFVTTATNFIPEGVGQADGTGRCTTEIVSFESADSVATYVEWKKQTGGLGYYVHFKTNKKFREDTAYLLYKTISGANLSDLLVFEGTSIEEYATVAEYSPMNGTDTSDTMLIQEKNLTKGINDKLNQAASAVQPEHLKPNAYPWSTELPSAHYSFPVLNASALGDFAKLCNSARICAADNNHLKLNTIYAHCPTIKIIDGIAYVAAFQNSSNGDSLKGATIELFRANITEWTVIDQTNVAAAGLACGSETLTDGCIDPNMLNIDNQTLRITFTTRFSDGGHRMCYRDYDIATGAFSDIGICKISDGTTTHDFDIPGIRATCGDFTATNPQIYMAAQYATFNSEYYIALSLGIVYKDAPILKTTDFITFTHWATPVVEGNNMQYECALVACKTSGGSDFLYSASRQYKDYYNEDTRKMLISRISLSNGTVSKSMWVPDGNIRPFWHTRGEVAYLWHTLDTDRNSGTVTGFNINALSPHNVGTVADTAAMIYATAEAYGDELIVCYMRKNGLFISRIPKVRQYDYADVIPMLEKFLDYFGTK